MKNPEALAEAVANMNEVIANLMACENNDYILAYDNGLGIRFIEPGKPAACALWVAEAIVTQEQAAKMPEEAWAYTPIVKNGRGEQAKLLPRQVAIKAEIAKVEGLIEWLKAA